MPTIHWTPLRSGNKATLMVVDLDIENRPSPNLFHYLETNIVGNTVGSGDIQFAFYPPFSFKYEGGNVLIDDAAQGQKVHRRRRSQCQPRRGGVGFDLARHSDGSVQRRKVDGAALGT